MQIWKKTVQRERKMNNNTPIKKKTNIGLKKELNDDLEWVLC